jgi:hypothetical protein
MKAWVRILLFSLILSFIYLFLLLLLLLLLLGEPLMHFGFPIHQMIGAIRNPTDYVDFRERFYDCQKQGLIAVCACTMQLYDESEGVLGNPEQVLTYSPPSS